MASSLLSKLKSSSASSIDKLREAKSKADTPSYKEDEARFWKPTKNKLGNASAVIRFLPNKDVDQLPYTKLYNHAFKGPGGWLFENCPTTLGRDCPVCKANSELWNSGVDANKEIARQRKRKLSYVSNIYVVSDPQNPDAEGKVWLYKYGKKIHDKINAQLSPEFEDDQPVNVFDIFAGANFRLKVKKVADFDNYDDSTFAQPSEFLDGDEAALEAVLDKLYDLGEFTDPTKYKDDAELRARLDKVLGGSGGRRPARDEDDEAPPARSSRSVDDEDEAPVARRSKPVVDDEDDEDMQSRIAKLLEEDD